MMSTVLKRQIRFRQNRGRCCALTSVVSLLVVYVIRYVQFSVSATADSWGGNKNNGRSPKSTEEMDRSHLETWFIIEETLEGQIQEKKTKNNVVGLVTEDGGSYYWIWRHKTDQAGINEVNQSLLAEYRSGSHSPQFTHVGMKPIRCWYIRGLDLLYCAVTDALVAVW